MEPKFFPVSSKAKALCGNVKIYVFTKYKSEESVNVKSVLYDITRERCCCKPAGQMLALPCWILATCYLLKRLRGRFEESKKQWKSMRFTARWSSVADGQRVVLKRERRGWVGWEVGWEEGGTESWAKPWAGVRCHDRTCLGPITGQRGHHH